MSEMRRAARSLVETRTERFESLHGLEESRRRLDDGLERLRPWRTVDFTRRWDTESARPILLATFAAPPRTQRLLKALSFGMAMLVAVSAWAMLSREVSGVTAFLLPLVAALAILGFPFLVLGLASARQADESRIRKAIRVALLDEHGREAPSREDDRLPPPQKWEDED